MTIKRTDGHDTDKGSAPAAFFFDVDGVITDPEKRVAEKPILDRLSDLLVAGTSIALNSGRSYSWVAERVIAPWQELARQRGFASLDQLSSGNLCVVGEMGAQMAMFDTAAPTVSTDPEMSVPPILWDRIDDLVRTTFSETMFVDRSKETMLSVEMSEGLRYEVYAPLQPVFVDAAQRILAEERLIDRIQVDPTRIAVNFQHVTAGKQRGARRALEWLTSRGKRPRRVIAMGDSVSDIAMAEEVHRWNIECVYVFVGGAGVVDPDAWPFDVVTTTELFVDGTLEFLRAQ